MKKTLLLAFAVMSMAACKKETTPEPVTQDEGTQTEIKTETVTTDCYVYEKNGNKIELHLQRNGQEASGKLAYALSEKDGNIGDFKGKMENNILLADYTFESEGTSSTRQVAFKLQGDQMIEGYGEMNEEGTRFKDASKLEFSSTMPLSKTDCPTDGQD